MGTADSHQHTTDNGINVTHPGDIDPHGIGRLGIFAHGPQIQTIAGFV